MEFYETFWSDKFWLPINVTWSDIEPGTRNGVTFRNYSDLWWSIPLAIFITIVKYFAVRFCFVPLGNFFQIKSTKPQPPPKNVILEQFYRKRQKQPSKMQLTSLTKQTDLTEREIERWWRKRHAQDKGTMLEKFCNNCWRCTFYLFNFSLGLSLLWNKQWLWTLNYIEGYPYHSIDNGIRWYYSNTCAFYLSLSFTHFYETRRKDFWEMFIHHVITIMLLSVSWTCNWIRYGCAVVFVHDVTDILLEALKASKYAKAEKLTTGIFVVFIFVWIYSRLYVYGRIVQVTVTEFTKIYPFFSFYLLISTLLIGLLCLHIMWTFFLLKVIYRVFKTSEIDDSRSSSEESSDNNE